MLAVRIMLPALLGVILGHIAQLSAEEAARSALRLVPGDVASVQMIQHPGRLALTLQGLLADQPQMVRFGRQWFEGYLQATSVNPGAIDPTRPFLSVAPTRDGKFVTMIPLIKGEPPLLGSPSERYGLYQLGKSQGVIRDGYLFLGRFADLKQLTTSTDGATLADRPEIVSWCEDHEISLYSASQSPDEAKQKVEAQIKTTLPAKKGASGKTSVRWSVKNGFSIEHAMLAGLSFSNGRVRGVVTIVATEGSELAHHLEQLPTEPAELKSLPGVDYWAAAACDPRCAAMFKSLLGINEPLLDIELAEQHKDASDKFVARYAANWNAAECVISPGFETILLVNRFADPAQGYRETCELFDLIEAISDEYWAEPVQRIAAPITFPDEQSRAWRFQRQASAPDADEEEKFRDEACLRSTFLLIEEFGSEVWVRYGSEHHSGRAAAEAAGRLSEQTIERQQLAELPSTTRAVALLDLRSTAERLAQQQRRELVVCYLTANSQSVSGVVETDFGLAVTWLQALLGKTNFKWNESSGRGCLPAGPKIDFLFPTDVDEGFAAPKPLPEIESLIDPQDPLR